MLRTPAQDSIQKELITVNAKIASFVSVKKTIGLSTELKINLDKCEKEKELLEKKLKRKIIEQKSQVKSREKKAKKKGSGYLSGPPMNSHVAICRGPR